MSTPTAIPTAADVAVDFLTAMAAGDSAAAIALLHPDLVYTNVGWPTLRHAGTVKVLRGLDGPVGFGVRFLNVSADGDTVLTERIDELSLGRLHWQFWVCGRFEIRDGLVVGWRDYFDHLHAAAKLIPALAAVAIPSIQRPLPPPATI
ncbi:limonene-1,2-epoxide hydrolase family protein [Williamsia maris]|uniref:Limonene-1,2-epoxide hydrolase n=1 Tax=Williamsia maris TaxID=72806 RepID=A0ABT1HC04_9NOCA|nr:limonene-1,2-epoxide hydrolase family protein [Williamsia maris]MCP2174510.1 limonene-1,2-epoxide hydrolase [Williamsia maris]